MNTKAELLLELFNVDVTFTLNGFRLSDGNLAKWENYKHPENSNFRQIVNWSAWESNGNLVVVYYLDKTNCGKNHFHSKTPMYGMTFEEAAFNFWKNN